MGCRTHPAPAGRPRTHSLGPRGWEPPPGGRGPTVTNLSPPAWKPTSRTHPEVPREILYKGVGPQGWAWRPVRGKGILIPLCSSPFPQWDTCLGSTFYPRVCLEPSGSGQEMAVVYSWMTWKVPEEGPMGRRGSALEWDGPALSLLAVPSSERLPNRGLPQPQEPAATSRLWDRDDSARLCPPRGGLQEVSTVGAWGLQKVVPLPSSSTEHILGRLPKAGPPKTPTQGQVLGLCWKVGCGCEGVAKTRAKTPHSPVYHTHRAAETTTNPKGIRP